VLAYSCPALDLSALFKLVGKTVIAIVTYSRYVVKSMFSWSCHLPSTFV